jgi:hypothetical protein
MTAQTIAKADMKAAATKVNVLKVMAIALPMFTVGTGTVVVGTGLLAFSAPSAYAAAKQQQVSSKVGKPLSEAMGMAQQKKFKEALVKVKEAQGIASKTPYETFKVNEILAYVSLNLADYATASKAYEDNIGSGLVPQEQLGPQLKTIIKLNYQGKNYAKVQSCGQRYLKDVGADNEISMLMAQAYYIQKDYTNCAKLTSQLIQSKQKAGAKPEEDLLKLLMSSQHNLDQRDQVIATLEQLLALYPSDGYWKDMFSYLLSAPGANDRYNLEVFRLKLETVGLDEKESVEMAELAMALGVPGDAQAVLQKGQDSGQLGKGGDAAREARLLQLAKTNSTEDRKSLPSLDTESRSAKTGEPSAKLGEAYLSYADYPKAAESIARGISKGDLKSTDEAQLHLGIANAKLKRNKEAIAAFNSVPASSKLQKVAKLWAIRLGKA